MLQTRRFRSICVERKDGTWDAAEREGFQIRTADAGCIHDEDRFGDGFISGTESVGRLHDHNLAIKGFDAMAAEEFRSTVMEDRSAIKICTWPTSRTAARPMHVVMPVL